MFRLTLQDVRARQATRARQLRAANAGRMRRVAAAIPAPVIVPGQGPARKSREAVPPARETASTTTTRAGGLSGCFSQSA